jgi:hypothetical protein
LAETELAVPAWIKSGYQIISTIAIAIRKITSHVKVEKSIINASFFFPSQNKITGFPKIKSPVMAADMTNSRSINKGIRKLADSPKICPPLKIIQDIAVT